MLRLAVVLLVLVLLVLGLVLVFDLVYRQHLLLVELLQCRILHGLRVGFEDIVLTGLLIKQVWLVVRRMRLY